MQLNNIAFAEKLSQADYDQFIAMQTKIVNETKHILDDPDQNADAQSQRQAFCQRLTAYEEIQKVSEERWRLESCWRKVCAMAAEPDHHQDGGESNRKRPRVDFDNL